MPTLPRDPALARAHATAHGTAHAPRTHRAIPRYTAFDRVLTVKNAANPGAAQHRDIRATNKPNRLLNKLIFLKTPAKLIAQVRSLAPTHRSLLASPSLVGAGNGILFLAISNAAMPLRR